MVKDLGKLYRRFVNETLLVLDCFSNARNAVCPAQVEEMSVIRLHDAWARFCKELIVISSYARPYSTNGMVIPRAPGIDSRQNALNRAMIRTRGGNRREPRWADANESIDAAQRLGIVNLSNVSMGLGVTPSPVDDLRRVRNFFAHRNDTTAQHVRRIAHSIGVPMQTPPRELLRQLQAPSGVTLFETWVNKLRHMAYIAVQYP
jgi:hypothetical protein